MGGLLTDILAENAPQVYKMKKNDLNNNNSGFYLSSDKVLQK